MALNKISPPALGKVLPRERLFNLIDLSPPTAAVWLSAPGGSGKTTLIASYLASRNLPCLWYQIESGDADLSTFFYYLGQAASGLLGPQDPDLPLLTPEYLLGVKTFAQRYFETLFERLKGPCWIVFDDFQELPEDAQVQKILCNAMARLPPGIAILVASRSNPPPAMARLQANRMMKPVGWKQLAFTFQELKAVLRILGRHSFPDTELRELHHLTQGWIAGLILWLMRSDADPASRSLPPANTPETIFDYFSHEVLRRIDRPTHHFLLQTSFLAQINAPAADNITGLKNSRQILETLCHHNFFLQKRAGSEESFQYHPLFSVFLRKQAGREFPEEKFNALCCRAAAIAAAAGNVEHAVALYTEARAWGELIDLIQQHAPLLYFQGRHSTLAYWLEHLPQERVAGNPWLLFWQGVGSLPRDPLRGRRFCTRAFREFRHAGDTFGQILSLAAAVESYFILRSDMRGLDYWIKEGQKLEAASDEIGDLNISGRFAAAMLGALTLRAPGHPAMGGWIQRCTAIMSQRIDIQLQVILGNFLVLIHCWHGNVDKAKLTLDRLACAFEIHHLDPLPRIMFSVMRCVYCLTSGESRRCLKLAQEAQAISATTGVHVYDGLICSYCAYGALGMGDLATARRFLDQMALTLKPHETADVALYHHLCAWEKFASGDLAMARTQIQTALELGEANGAPIAPVISGRLLQGRIELAAGDIHQAEVHLENIVGRSRAEGCSLIEFQELLTEAWFCFSTHEVIRGNRFLERAFQLSREKNILDGNLWLRSQLAQLCQKALQADIEPEQVRRFIERHRLAPHLPCTAGPQWPWAVKIHLLGGLEIFCRHRSLQLSAKTPRKPLELLKLLVTCSARGISREALADELWPDSDGDRALQNIHTTLHRLRRLLGEDQAVILKKGCLSFNPELCWVDCWQFEDWVRQARSQSNPDLARELLERAVSLYAGHVDGDLEACPSILGYAQRLKAMWVKAVVDLGRLLRESGQAARSEALQQNALALDGEAEPIYRSLMALLGRQGRIDDALLIFKRCRRALAGADLEPARETQALYRNLKSSLADAGRPGLKN